ESPRINGVHRVYWRGRGGNLDPGGVCIRVFECEYARLRWLFGVFANQWRCPSSAVNAVHSVDECRHYKHSDSQDNI
ncbi:MAG: hypothetical protein ACKOAH_22010, partial [Pirellula sp.]